MVDSKAIFIYSNELEKFQYPPDNPLRTERAGKLRKLLLSLGLLTGDDRAEVAPVAAKRLVLKKIHTARYLHTLKKASDGDFDHEAFNMGIGSADCPVFKGMYDYAVLAAGATVVGAEHIIKGKAKYAFNPSGGYHHAGPEKAAGFCYINDVAIACSILAEAGLRVFYLDVDVHFGDGVAYAFYDRDDVLTVSMHETPKMLFPGTGFEDEIGSGAGKGYCVNVPLPVGTYDQAYMHVFNEIVPPLVRAYKPDVFVFELGADGLAGDPLAHLHLTNNVYADVINKLLSFKKPILMTGGGGYNIDNTIRAWALAWTVLTGIEADPGIAATIGGVMMESTDWQGGFRDRQLPVTDQQRNTVIPAISKTIDTIKKNIFPIHGL